MFRALVVERSGEDTHHEIRDLEDDFLVEGDVIVDVAYSSVNYKDALATLPNGGVARTYPLIPGIDFAGIVTHSDAPRFDPGDLVIGGAGPLGVSHHGGFAQSARVPEAFLVPVPESLDARGAMAAGTAGMTAAMAVERLEELGLAPERGPVLVTGATGGVGTWSLALLSQRGYEVHAATGKSDRHSQLKELGATDVIERESIAALGGMLESRRWAGAIDAVGGETLAYVLTAIDHGGVVVATGNTSGMKVPTTVAPFILRGVTLTGIDSAAAGPEERAAAWDVVAAAPRLDHLIEEVDLDGLSPVLRRILAGDIAGRVVVRP